MRIILLLMVLTFMANITVTSPRNPLLAKKTDTTKTVLWKTGRMQKFIKSVEEECSFGHFDYIYKDLKGMWNKALTEGNTNTLMETDDVPEFLMKLTDLYNKCREKRLNIDFEQQWEIYLKIFGKEYNESGKEMRKAIFRKKKQDVEKHNSLFRNGSVSYSANLNHLSDWTEKELEMMNGFRQLNATIHGHSGRKARFLEVEFRKDYLDEGRRGICRSCYAIAGLGALEAHHRKLTGELVRLSVQNILDCTWHLRNAGCGGGQAVTVFQYAYSSGIVSNRNYPYTMNASHNCRWRREDVISTNRGYYRVEPNSELALRNAVADYGPVAAAITAHGLSNYRSGVFSSRWVRPLNHAVLVVGYGTDPQSGDYWIVKNSWGYWWGENGYARIARNKNNICRIASGANFPY